MRPGAAVRLLGLSDAVFESELAERGARADAPPPLDLAFVCVREPRDLERLATLRELLRPDGAIWVLRTKGSSRAVTEMDIIEAGKRHGLVDNKIASFSETLSAMRLVIPLSLRKPGRGE